MKFFTKIWWESGCENAEHLFAEYDAYFSSIRDRLPKSLIELHEEHTLHDSEVKRITSYPLEGNVSMELLGWDINLQFPVRYHLNFLGVSRFEQIFPQEEYVEQELGDLGYWECESISSSTEMRMLFISGAQFTVVFSGLDLTCSTVKT